MTVNGSLVDTQDFLEPSSSSFLIYNENFADEFSGIADFGPVMPTGLSSQELHYNLRFHQYYSPLTGSEARSFRLIMEIPEPTTAALGVVGAACFLVLMRKREQRN